MKIINHFPGILGNFCQDPATIGTILAVTAGAGIVGQVITGGAEAEARGAAAEAELEEARRTREAALEAAEPSPEELEQLERAVELNEQDISRKERLLESADPVLIETGKQAIQLLQGEEARTLDPIRRQRQEDRTRLEDSLRGQLGSGFATSTAGIQALNDFDAETGSLLAVEQDRSLGRLLGVAERVSQQGFGGAVARAGTLGQLFGRIGERRVSAITQTPITPFAEAPFVEQAERARFGRETFGQLTGAATTGLTLGAIFGFPSFGGGGGGGLKTGTPITDAGFDPTKFSGVA